MAPPFMSTVSLWESSDAAMDYAYSGQEAGHPEAVAANRDLQVFDLPVGCRELAAKLGERYWLAIENNRAIAMDIDRAAPLGFAELAYAADFGHGEIDFPLDLGEPRADHKENDQVEDDIDHRRQIDRREIVLMGFEGHD